MAMPFAWMIYTTNFPSIFSSAIAFFFSISDFKSSISGGYSLFQVEIS